MYTRDSILVDAHPVIPVAVEGRRVEVPIYSSRPPQVPSPARAPQLAARRASSASAAITHVAFTRGH
eukprot:scaffold11764_cov91-Phaeocystis_antarctica.AAC.4